MKFRYIVRTFVEAESLQDALRIAQSTKPHEAYIDDKVWEKREYALNPASVNLIGFKPHDKRKSTKGNKRTTKQ